jgi:hypothetical protein
MRVRADRLGRVLEAWWWPCLMRQGLSSGTVASTADRESIAGLSSTSLRPVLDIRIRLW